MAPYDWVVVVSWILFLVVWVIAARRTKRTLFLKDGGKGWLLRIAIALGILALFNTGVLPRSFIFLPQANPFSGWFGAVLTLVGVGIAMWARYHLGTNWGRPTAVKENAELVTSGPYAYVRHPIYSGMMVAMTGSGFFAHIWWFFSIAAIAYFLYSAPLEEKTMSDLFPDAYAAYKIRTNMLIPFIF